MKPLTTLQKYAIGASLAAAFCFVSNDDYNTLYVEPIMTQAYHDELHQDREALNRLQKVAGELLALQEMK